MIHTNFRGRRMPTRGGALNSHRSSVALAAGFALVTLPGGEGAGAAGGAKTLAIDDAVAYALGHSPRLKEADAGRELAAARTWVARDGLLPDLTVTAQVDRATGNVVPGALFSVRGLPIISGPPRGRTFDSGTFGSAAGVGASWDVFLLVRQMAAIDVALAETSRTDAAAAAVRLDVAFTAADRFLAVVSRGEIVRVARASVERDRVFATIVKALADQALRPGVDVSRAQAELALAQAQLIRGEQNEAVARIELAQALGNARMEILPAPGPLLARRPTDRPIAAVKHPALIASEAAVSATRARQRSVSLEYLPRLELLGALWIRGSGYFPDGNSAPPGNGLVPDTPNWAAGVALTWPVLETVAVRARARAEAANVKISTARLEDLAQLIDSQLLGASAVLDSAKRIAGETPVAVSAARAAETQATARYRSGLTTVLEVAEAERLLTEAEIEDAEARLGVWSALLLVCRAAGDIGPFLAEAASGGVQ